MSAPPGTAVAYQDINFGGSQFGPINTGFNFPNLGTYGWNDKISSIAVAYGVRVICFENSNYGGSTCTFDGNAYPCSTYNDFRNYGFNDKTSSMQVMSFNP